MDRVLNRLRRHLNEIMAPRLRRWRRRRWHKGSFSQPLAVGADGERFRIHLRRSCIAEIVKTAARTYSLSDEVAAKVVREVLPKLQPGDSNDVIIRKIRDGFRPYVQEWRRQAWDEEDAREKNRS